MNIHIHMNMYEVQKHLKINPKHIYTMNSAPHLITMVTIYLIHPEIFHINKCLQKLQWKMFFLKIHSNQVLQQMLLFGPEYEREEHKSLFLSHQTHVDKLTMAPDNRAQHGSCYSPTWENCSWNSLAQEWPGSETTTLCYISAALQGKLISAKFLDTFTGGISSTNELSWSPY